MTSDRGFDQSQERLLAFSDQVYAGTLAQRTGIDPDLASAVLRLKRADRVPAFDPSRVDQRKDSFMSLITAAAVPPLQPGATGPSIPHQNGARHAPRTPPVAPRLSRNRVMAWVSIAILIAMIGALGYGILTRQQDEGPALPAVMASPSPASPLLGQSWGQFRGGLDRTGYTTDPGPGSDLSLRWSFSVDESLNSIVEADGRVIAYGAEGGLYAVDALTGEQLWAIDLSPRESLDTGRVSLPAVVDGTVYVSTQDGVLIALSAETGDILWQSPLEGLVSAAPAVAQDTIYVVTGGETLHALDPANGSERWSSALPDSISTQYPTVVNGMYIYPGDSGAVNALDANTGAVIWKTEPLLAHRVAAYGDGRLFVPTQDGGLVALDASKGTTLWEADRLGNEGLNAVVTPDSVIVAVDGTSVRSLDPVTGDVQWTLETPDLGTESPHAAGDTLYLNFGNAGSYNAVDLHSGQIQTTVDAAGAGSTAAISGQLLFVSGRDGPVRAFGPVEGQSNEVQGTPPALSYQATPLALQTSAAPEPQAPNTGDIQVVTIGKIERPPTEPTLGLLKGPNGLLWRVTLGGNTEIFDRDLNLLETRTYGEGSGPGQFDLTYSGDISWGAAAAVWMDDDTVYLTDASNHRIQVLDADGTYLRSWGTEGTADGQLLEPMAIARTPDGNLVVADIGRHDLQWFDTDGNFLRKLTGPEPGKDFRHPVDVAFDPDGNMWVLDHTLGQLFKFDQDGKLLFTVGEKGAAPGQFNEPSDIDIDDQGRVWVADQTNMRIQVFDSNGNLLGTFDGCVDGSGCFRRPGVVVAGGNNYLYVMDYDNNGIQDEYTYKYLITSMPDVPSMAAATPAAQ